MTYRELTFWLLHALLVQSPWAFRPWNLLMGYSMAMQCHARGTNLLEVATTCTAYIYTVYIPPEFGLIWYCTYLHFRILKFALIYGTSFCLRTENCARKINVFGVPHQTGLGWGVMTFCRLCSSSYNLQQVFDATLLLFCFSLQHALHATLLFSL